MSQQTTSALDRGPQGLTPKKVRWIAIGVVSALVAALVIAIMMDAKTSETGARFDTLEAIRKQYTPSQDPLWSNPHGVYNAEREEFIGTLEAFLDREAASVGGVLEAHTRFLIARTAADHILSNPEMFDQGRRNAWYAKAKTQLEAIASGHPEFPTNWTALTQGSAPTLTRQFLDWIEKNMAWEAKHLPTSGKPTGEHVVVFRTDRGDLRVRLFESQASEWTAEFLKVAASGALDGRAFVEKRQVGTATDAQEHTVRVGPEESTGIAPFDRKAVDLVSKYAQGAGQVPALTRSTVLHERGIVSAWHARADEYDDGEQLLFVARNSPMMDYDFTPVGRLDDDASLATLDRIFATPTWRDDAETLNGSEWRGIMDYLQAPPIIVKVLVYSAAGSLMVPAEAAAAQGRVPPTADEATLSGLKADAYKVEPPAKPVVPEKSAEPAKDTDE